MTPIPSGILLLDKPTGITSNTALSRAKRVLGIKKAGHTGTLDPMASGLLVLCFGEATKVSGFLLDGDKRYQATIRLGLTTSTDDAEGEVLDTQEVPPVDVQGLEAVLGEFRGPIEQVPPMVSALKHQGQRLYKLARAGQVVERAARSVTIHTLELQSLQRLDTQGLAVTDLVVDVQCSKGTYIRALARDIGGRLGCGGHLVALRRTASAPFGIEEAIDLVALEATDQAAARARMKSADHALVGLPALGLSAAEAARVMLGQAVEVVDSPVGLVRLYSDGGFLGIAEVMVDGLLKPRRLMTRPLPTVLWPV